MKVISIVRDDILQGSSSIMSKYNYRWNEFLVIFSNHKVSPSGIVANKTVFSFHHALRSSPVAKKYLTYEDIVS